MLKKTCIALVLFSLQSIAFASNFSYTYLGIDIGKAIIDEKISLDGYLYEEMGSASINGSYQINNTAVLSVETSILANEGGHTEITYSNVEFILSYPITIGERFDIVPFIGSRDDEIEFCR